MQRHERLIVIGSGPSGYTTGIYAGRAQLAPLLFAGDTYGGQLMYTTEVENYPGFEKGIRGPQLMMEMRKQMLRFGAKVIDQKVTRVDFSQRPYRVWSGEEKYLTDAVVIATGAESITLGLEKEKELLGRGISTCAVCDAAFYKDKIVYVVGGGDSAVEDAMALTHFARKVHVLVRRDVLRASKIMQDRLLKNEKVEVLWNTEVKRLHADAVLEKIEIENNVSGEKKTVSADGLFFAIGHTPNSELFVDRLELNGKGYILTPLNGLHVEDISRTWLAGKMTMTSVEGVFAAGDVVDFRYRQAITAAAFGCMAALDAEKWLVSQE